MEQFESSRKHREAQAKSDLIGTIHNSEVYELLGFHQVTTEGEKESWAAFTEALGSVTGDVPASKRNDVEDRARDFGNEREETGFRLGLIDDEKTKLSVDDRVTNVTPNVMTNDGQMSTRDRDRDKEIEIKS